MKILIVVDMQNDFISGSLGTKEAEEIVSNVVAKIKTFDGEIFYTRDTHEKNYLITEEGKNLPVEHCIRETKGWELHPEIEALRKDAPIDKVTFGSVALAETLSALNKNDGVIEEITLVGLCTDICVISNALVLKAFMPEVPITVDAACCAGVTPQSHKRALEAMKACQIKIINE